MQDEGSVRWGANQSLWFSSTDILATLVATADIPADQVLFTIPRRCIICTATSSLVTALPQVFDPTEGQDEDHDMDGMDDGQTDGDDTTQDSWTRLILILIYEHLQGGNSKWKPYLDLLPASPTDFSTPMFWSVIELAELQASPVVSKVGRDEAEKMIRTKVLPIIQSHEDVFYPDNQEKLSEKELIELAFCVGSVIMAYAFDLEEDNDEYQEDEDEWVEDREGRTMLGMVPMADTLNADASFNAHIEHEPEDLIATSLRPIAKGEEILNYYGPLSNGELLRRYGYVTKTHRRWNLIDLTWESLLGALKAEISLSEKEWEKVLNEFVDEDGDSALEEGFVIDRDAMDPDSEGRVQDDKAKKVGIPEEMLAQMKEVLKAVKKYHTDAVPDKVARDKAIYAAIARASEARTKEYSTTLAQDLDLHQKAKVSSTNGVLDRKSMALEVRIGEKILLKELSEATQAKLEALAEDLDGDKRGAKRRRNV